MPVVFIFIVMSLVFIISFSIWMDQYNPTWENAPKAPIVILIGMFVWILVSASVENTYTYVKDYSIGEKDGVQFIVADIKPNGERTKLINLNELFSKKLPEGTVIEQYEVDSTAFWLYWMSCKYDYRIKAEESKK